MNTPAFTFTSTPVRPQPLGGSTSRFAALALALLMSLGTLGSLHTLAASGVPADNLARASTSLAQA